MIFIRHFKWGKHIRVTGYEPTNDDVAYAVGLLDSRFPPPAIVYRVTRGGRYLRWIAVTNVSDRERYRWIVMWEQTYDDSYVRRMNFLYGELTMEVTVKWEWDNNRPRTPWVYHVKIGDAERTGYCNAMADCWDAIEEFVADTVEKAIMKSVCQ